MTKQELIAMMGDEDKAEWAMEQILKMVKKDFVRSCLKAVSDEAAQKLEEREKSGYYTKFSNFPEGFTVWGYEDDHPLMIQYNKNRYRQIEHEGDRMNANFTRNMYAQSLWG